MTRYGLLLMLSLLLAACEHADVARLMEQYLWEKRVLILFAPAADNAALRKQNQLLTDHQEGLKERNIIVWRIVDGQSVSVDGEYMAQLSTPPFYRYFNVLPEGFAVILLGKDGEEKLRQSSAVPTDQLFRLIDAMPMCQREMEK